MRADELAPWDGVDLEEVGRGDVRLEARQKVTGTARYSSDVHLPGLLHAAVVRSPHPHARIRSVDVAPALAVEGVVDVLTAEHVGDVTWYDEDVPLLSDVVRFVGDEVAVVAATTKAAARRGAAAVAVDYEPLPHVTDARRALEPGAPLVFDDGNLADEPKEAGRGDVEAALARAAVVVEAVFATPAAAHNAMEPHGATAWWDGDQLTLYASTQGVNDVREAVAARLHLDHNQVRVVAEHVGGGFGAKQVPWKPTVLAALLSRQTGRPVQLMLDRRGENLAAGKRNATWQHVRLGADADGRLVAIDLDAVVDVGSYGVSGEASNVSGMYLHLYACDNVRTRQRNVRTHTGPAVAFRAPGYVEAAAALESAMDELARRLDLDPIELRLRSYTERDQQQDKPWSSPQALRRCYERAAEESGWGEPLEPSPTPGVRRGRGFAANEWMAGKGSPPGYAWLELNGDGSVHVATSAQDIGTGTRTALTQIVSEELGTAPERIRMTLGDTAAGPPAPTSSGSATMPTMGPAVRAAAADARQQVLVAAAEHLDADPAELRFDGTTITREGGEDLPLTDLLEALAPEGIHGHGGRTGSPEDVSVRTFGAAVADVEVDTATGEVRVLRVVVAPDCGRIVNPLLVESQVIGGATQGIGFALSEEQRLDHDRGVIVNGDLEEYLVPTVSDTGTIVHAAVDLPDLAANPLGVKGIGEPPMVPVPAAIANAVRDAIGVRIHELPLTRRRVLEALGRTEESR
ncbi:MAG: xanthine dehydrogenase family protein molybdopterin-binding subunit [Acidimicrobiia bacterium]